MRPLHSVDIRTKAESVGTIERSDVCAIPAAAVIAEAVVAFELANAFLEKFGGDSLTEITRNYQGYLRAGAQLLTPPGPEPMAPKLILTGFMATGKSAVGRAVAARLGWRFVDSDQRDRGARG